MNFLCNGIANWCRRNGAVSEEDYPIILYGIQVFFNTSLKVLGVLLAGALLHCFIAVLISMTVFCSMRYWTGGWHSKSHLGCFSSMLIIGVSPALFMKLDGGWIPWVLGCMLIYSAYKILRYAPCNSKVNPIEDLKILKNKRIGSIIELIGLSIAVIVVGDVEVKILILIPLFADAFLVEKQGEKHGNSALR